MLQLNCDKVFIMKKKYKYIIGVDEAGRGPIAGAVAVGAVLIPANFNKNFFRDIRDSKQLTKIQREMWFKKIKKNKNMRYIVCFSEAGQIDKLGIVKAVKQAIDRALNKLEAETNVCLVLLDGRLKAPLVYKNQKTIIKGDEKEPVISLASIVAKVSRDRKMVNLSKRYPEYGFEKHKGYGTKEHLRAVRKHGLCTIHRKSFLKKLSI
jgi:ribonuclease HII